MIATTTLGCDGGVSGIGRYAATLLQHWIARGVDLRVYGHDSDRAAFTPANHALPWRSVSERWKPPMLSLLWHQTQLPQLVRDADVLFLPAGNRRLPLHHTVPSVGTVHDCSSLHVEGKYDPARDFYIKQVLPRLMRRLDHIMTVSQSTRADLIQHCGVPPEKITVVPLAADPDMFFPQDRDFAATCIRDTYGVTAPFLLYIARIEHPGKNHTRLIEAFEWLKQRYGIPHQLVFVGPEKERSEEVHRAAANSSAASDILFTGPVPSRDLALLYAAAEVFVFPSLYEGFGLPVLESLACGTPVACSDRSSLPEVGGDCVTLFDPTSPESIVFGVLKLLEECPADRATRIQAGLLRAAQFSWQRTAQETLDVILRIGEGRPGRAA